MKIFYSLFSAVAIFIASPARADIFTGAHPELGTMTLSMNTLQEFGAGQGRSGNVVNSLHYTYSIESGSVRIYGSGESQKTGSVFTDSVDVASILNTDNLGNSCTGTLSRVWWGDSLRIFLKYDESLSCPKEGEGYRLTLEPLAKSERHAMVINTCCNPIAKTWLARDKERTQKLMPLLPGELVRIITLEHEAVYVETRGGTHGYVTNWDIILNDEFTGWGVY